MLQLPTAHRSHATAYGIYGTTLDAQFLYADSLVQSHPPKHGTIG